MYANVEIDARLFTLAGQCLLDTGSNVGLIDVKILPDSVVSKLTPLEQRVQGVGGGTTVRGSISGNIKLGTTTFSDVTFQVVDSITDDVKLIIGTGLFMHPSVLGFEVNVMAKTISFTRSVKSSGGATTRHSVTCEYEPEPNRGYEVKCLATARGDSLSRDNEEPLLSLIHI